MKGYFFGYFLLPIFLATYFFGFYIFPENDWVKIKFAKSTTGLRIFSRLYPEMDGSFGIWHFLYYKANIDDIFLYYKANKPEYYSVQNIKYSVIGLQIIKLFLNFFTSFDLNWLFSSFAFILMRIENIL